MNLETSTEILETVSGDTSLKKYREHWNISLLSKQQAHKVLDEVKAGVRHHPVLVTQALIATGDWTQV